MSKKAEFTAYQEARTLLAQQLQRGGKTVYVVSFPIALVPTNLPVPDPSRPAEDNRAVLESRANAFGKYWEENANWVAPPLLIDTEESLDFEILDLDMPAGAPKAVVLKIPNHSSGLFRILDGQHRIRGWYLIQQKLLAERQATLELVSKRRQAQDQLGLQVAQKKLAELEAKLERLSKEQISVEIITNMSAEEHRRHFVTIAENADGVNPSEKTRLDDDNLTSMLAKSMAATPLLNGRVEMRKTSPRKNSTQLFSLANVRDLVRILLVGGTGRVSRVMELDEQRRQDTYLVACEAFLDAMVEGVAALKDPDLSGQVLRRESLLGSFTIWRCLAAAYHDVVLKADESGVVKKDDQDHRQFVEMLRSISDAFDFADTDPRLHPMWEQTGCFNPGHLAPRSQAQDRKALSEAFVSWTKGVSPVK